MVSLIGSPYIPQTLYATKCFYLGHVADRAGLDYLPQSTLLSDGPSLPVSAAPDDLFHAIVEQQTQTDATRTSIRSA